MKKLKYVKCQNFSGASPFQPESIEVLKRRHYQVVDIFVSGDAPKEVIKVYEYKPGKRSTFKDWPIYIAKTGHKWYPYETITEFLLNKLGEVLGLEMALSRIVYAGGQVRFLSKYFLKKNQELIHGADIFAGYLGDKAFVETIEAQSLARDFFSVQFVKDSLDTVFPGDSSLIFKKLIELLVFDAIVGNNDRHFYNWGVIRDIFGKRQPYFSPIYDTARGLFWNETEKKLIIWSQDKKSLNQRLEKYARSSRPKIGWDKEKNLNHFDLVKLIKENELGITRAEFDRLVSVENENKFLRFLETDCYGLFRAERLELIKACLQLRFRILRE